MAYIFWFFVLVGILIFAHEGGHFLFAKLFRVKVLTFSLGFGTPIKIGKFKLSFKPKETEYRIAWFPIGGFVKMVGEDPTKTIPAEDMARAFSTQAIWKRALIIFGGPLFSILLAFPIYFTVHLIQTKALSPIIGRVIGGSPASKAGLQPGDTIIKMAGRDIETWEDVTEAVHDLEGKAISMDILREGKNLNFSVTPERELDETELYLMGDRYDLGIRHGRQANLIGIVSEDSPAGRAGLRTFDRIIAIGGKPVLGWQEIQQALESSGMNPVSIIANRDMYWVKGIAWTKFTFPIFANIQPDPADKAIEGVWHTQSAYFGFEPSDLYISGAQKGFAADKNGMTAGDKIAYAYGERLTSWDQFTRVMYFHRHEPIPIKILNNGEYREFSFVPMELKQQNELKQTMRKIGIGVMYMSNIYDNSVILQPHLLRHAVKMSYVEVIRAVKVNVMGFVRIFQGRIPASEALGSVMQMADVAKKMADEGADSFLMMMAMISILLGMLNLLPIPLLDGGQLVFLLIEAIRRRPLSIKTRVIASYVGLVFLVALMLFAFGSDINRYFFS